MAAMAILTRRGGISWSLVLHYADNSRVQARQSVSLTSHTAFLRVRIGFWLPWLEVIS